MLHHLKATVAAATVLVASVVGVKATTITFDGIAPSGGFSSYTNGPLTLSGVTFTSDGDMFIIDSGFYGDSYPNGGYLNTDYAGSVNTLNISLPGNVRSIAFDYGGLLGPGNNASVIINGGAPSVISSANSISGTNSLSHFTFNSTTDITSLVLKLPDFPGYNAIDNFSFSSAAPEPSTWAMMLLGFIGLGFAGYRTRLKAVSPA